MTPAQLAKNQMGLTLPVVVNMLTTQPSAVGQGTWARYQSNAMLYGGCYYSGGSDGDNFSFEVSLPKGTYRIDFNYIRSTDRGIVDVYVDGVEVGSVDMYGAENNLMVGSITGVAIDGSNPHTIMFKIDGKHASSGGYVINLGAIQFFRTGN